MMMNLFAENNDIPENLPLNVLDHYKLVGRNEALKAIHFPKDVTELNAAIRRLKFEEFFFLNLANLSLKKQSINKRIEVILFQKLVIISIHFTMNIYL